MKINKIIGEEIQNLAEEFTGNKLYGYHCTPCENLESIELNGFKVGQRSMQGTGVYGFFNLTDESSGNAAVGYGQRHLSSQGFCVVKFEIEYPNWLLILDKKIAEDVLGAQADIIMQIEKEFDSWEEYWERIYVRLRPEYQTPEFEVEFKAKLRNDFENAYDGRELMFGTANLESMATFGVIYDGEYGMQYLIKAPNIMKPLGYHEVGMVNGRTSISELKPFGKKADKLHQAVQNDPKYKDLEPHIRDINNADELQRLKHDLMQKQNGVRNNKEYDYYDNLITLITDLENKDIQEGVGDKYAEKQFNIPDADKQYQDMGVPDADMGEKITQVWGSNYKGSKSIYGYVYKNPKTLKGFDAEVRAIGLANGDLYVAQQDGVFIHVDIEMALEKKIGYLDNYIELHRVGTTNDFGASDTLIHKLNTFDFDIGEYLEALQARHPQFGFSPNFYQDLGEGLGDKYLKNKGVMSDPDDNYKSQTQAAIQDPSNGEFIGYTRGNYSSNSKNYRNDKESPVYKNPKSLRNFDAGVRALSDSEGNLYVGQFNRDYMHGGMEHAIKRGSNAYDINWGVSWQRIGETNKFGLSDTSAGYLTQRNTEKQELFSKHLNAVRKANPGFEFVPEYHWDIREAKANNLDMIIEELNVLTGTKQLMDIDIDKIIAEEINAIRPERYVFAGVSAPDNSGNLE